MMTITGCEVKPYGEDFIGRRSWDGENMLNRLYNRSMGKKGKDILSQYPEESKKYTEMMLKHSGLI